MNITLKIFFAFLGLAFIGGYADISVDYPGYVIYFKCAQSIYCADSMNNIEGSFVYGAQLFGLIFGTDSAALFLFCIAAMSFLLKIKVMEDSGNFWLLAFCYMALQFFHHEMTQLRVGLGIAFLWIGIMRKKETGHFPTLFFALSILSHYSMVIGVLFFVVFSVVKFKLSSFAKLYLVILVYMVSAIFGYYYNFFVDLLPDVSFLGRVAVYISAVGSEPYYVPQFSVQLIVTLLLSLVAFFLPRSSLTDALHNMVVSGVGIYLAFYWIPVIPLRVFEVLASVIPIYFALAFNGEKRLLAKGMVFFLCALVFLNWHVRNNMFSEDNEKVISNLEELSQ
ncbi:hypothetical protein PMI22_01150 [Pseudomonas sp. GM21]|uniref:EpsG family protein n=1 Tax=Pseudomonas sp. GM21 TaxID=1144325 RepID=UPI0002723B77|nr:EpsG family protein [Pseudomonas sp. GM21]EJM23603.1 hypothetical protein PMI22_01150 [Pseudomonas sp. GM21]